MLGIFVTDCVLISERNFLLAEGTKIAYLSESWINQLTSKLDIVDVIGRYTHLEKKGAKYWACCPFHIEKTASFAIRQDQQSYHCFGCGKSGNVITFVMEHERLTFLEACEHLANMVGLAMPDNETPEQKEYRAKREKAIAVLKLSAHYYVDNLYKPSGKIARDYVTQRGLSAETLRDFGVGYSPDYNTLPVHIRNAGYEQDIAIYAGVLSSYEGKVTDFEATRLVIPIINAKNEVIAFGGRRLDGKKEYKYKNTSATAIFDKRRTLFAINMIKRLQQKEIVKHLILVEGYMDVISLYQAGIKNAIASMGTSLTIEQCKEIKRYTNLIYVCFDGDAAGQNATSRSLDLLSEAGLEVKVVSLPDNLDPDDAVRKFGRDGFLSLVEAALPLIEFKLAKVEKAFNLTSLDGKKKYANAAVAVLSSLDSITRGIYLKVVSEKSGLSEEAISNSVITSRPIPKFTPRDTQPTETVIAPELRSAIIACRFILSSILSLKKYVNMSEIIKEYFEYPIHNTIFAYIEECINDQKLPQESELYNIAPESNAEISKVIYAVNNIPVADQAAYYKDCIASLVKMKKDKRKKLLIERINKLEDGDEKNLLKKELLALLSQK